MREKNNFNMMCLAVLVLMAMPGATCQARMQAQKDPYPTMAPLEQYLMPDEKSEIALARSAAPVSISDGAEGIYADRERHERFSLHRGTFLGRDHRSPGILESQSARRRLL